MRYFNYCYGHAIAKLQLSGCQTVLFCMLDAKYPTPSPTPLPLSPIFCQFTPFFILFELQKCLLLFYSFQTSKVFYMERILFGILFGIIIYIGISSFLSSEHV